MHPLSGRPGGGWRGRWQLPLRAVMLGGGGAASPSWLRPQRNAVWDTSCSCSARRISTTRCVSCEKGTAGAGLGTAETGCRRSLHQPSAGASGGVANAKSILDAFIQRRRDREQRSRSGPWNRGDGLRMRPSRLSAPAAAATSASLPSTSTSTSTNSSSLVQAVEQPPPMTELPPPAGATAPGAAPIPASLVQKLYDGIQKEKRIPFDALPQPVQALRALAERERFRVPLRRLAHLAVGSPMDGNAPAGGASQRPDDRCPCWIVHGGTGTGKSSTVPLMLLDAHWEAVQERLLSTLTRLQSPSAVVGMDADGAPQPYDTTSTAAFVRDVGASRRVQIIVSQPTRLACTQLAAFVAGALESGASHPTEGDAPRRVVGSGRVGYAIAGDASFTDASEIVFATPGYILQAMRRWEPPSVGRNPAPPRVAVQPTLLVVDEAHCRDVETDLLLAWVRRQRLSSESGVACSAAPSSSPATAAVRAVVVMSATMNVPQLAAYFGMVGKEWVALIGGAAAESSLVPVGGSGKDPRVEVYYLDNLFAQLRTSTLLRKVSESSSTVGQSPAPLPLFSPLHGKPVCDEVERLFFAHRWSTATINQSHSLALGELTLLLMTSLPDRALLGDAEGPQTVVVFLPGLAEMTAVLNSIESLAPCLRHRSQRDGQGAVAQFQYKELQFHVALLHATAIGDPAGQLRSTTALPYRIVLATNIAESSVTIPNVVAVVDTATERQWVADPLTGVTVRRTSIVSYSSMLQRRGRAGRTAPGIVIHLVPQHVVPAPQLLLAAGMTETTWQADASHREGEGEATLQRAAAFSSRAPALVLPMFSSPQSLLESPVALLLRVKALFAPQDAADVVRHLLDPPGEQALHDAVQELLSQGFAERLYPVPGGSSRAVGKARPMVSGTPDAYALLAATDLTTKGRIVAQLPLPPQLALLVYYGLLFHCVEDAVLVAAAMSFPTLLVAPRLRSEEVWSPGDLAEPGDAVGLDAAAAAGGDTRGLLRVASASQRSDASAPSRASTSPLFEFYRMLWGQRQYARVSAERYVTGTEPVYTLSEPLVYRDLLRQWYASSTVEVLGDLYRQRGISPSMLRTTDLLVAQCCGRLIDLLHSDATSLPLVHPNGQPALLASLHRLRSSAQSHSVLRKTTARNASVTQWYPQEEYIRRLYERSPRGPPGTSRAAASHFYFGSGDDRLLAAFVAAFGRNTLRAEVRLPGAAGLSRQVVQRNAEALGNDAGSWCTFLLSLTDVVAGQGGGGRDGRVVSHAAPERLTSAALTMALAPYMTGLDCLQVDVLSGGSTGLVRFGSPDPEPAEAGTHAADERLLPQPLPYECVVEGGGSHGGSTVRRSAAVRLAPLGISVLVAARHALRHIPARLERLPPPLPLNRLSPRGLVANVEFILLRRGRRTRQLPPARRRQWRRIHRATTGVLRGPAKVGDELLGVRWRTGAPAPNAWSCIRVVDARRLGYDSFLPLPQAPTATAGDSMATAAHWSPRGTPQEVQLSLGRVRFAGEIHWEVTLPRNPAGVDTPLVVPPRPTADSPDSPAGEGDQSNRQSPGAPEQYYCVVCRCYGEGDSADAWRREHFRAPAHLLRLSQLIQRQVHDESLPRAPAPAAASPPPALEPEPGAMVLQPTTEAEAAMVAMAMVANASAPLPRMRRLPCHLSSLSFLNALQYIPRPVVGGAAQGPPGTPPQWHNPLVESQPLLPVAIAGSLALPTSSSGSLLDHSHVPHHPEAATAAATSLRAAHVWIADLQPPLRTEGTPDSPPLPSTPSLLFLAGYLAGATPDLHIPVLTDAQHAYVYAVMRCGPAEGPMRASNGGVVVLGERLPMAPIREALRAVVDGRPWCGVWFAADTSARVTAALPPLHWCTLTCDCPGDTYGSGWLPSAADAPHAGRLSHDAMLTLDAAVLLVLYEYRTAHVPSASWADVLQRLHTKIAMGLRHGTIPWPESGQDRGAAPAVEEVLAEYLRVRRQTLPDLLRDVGCVLLAPAGGGMDARDAVALHHARLTVPAVLPTYLPAPRLTEALQAPSRQGER